MFSLGPVRHWAYAHLHPYSAALRKVRVKVPGPGMSGSGCSPQPVSRARVKKHATLPSGVHAHDGAQQLAALDRMVPALLSLPSHHRLLHDPALLHQGKHGFKRLSDIRAWLDRRPEVVVASPQRPQDSTFVDFRGVCLGSVERSDGFLVTCSA